MIERKLTGKIARERIRRIETPRPPDGIIEAFRALGGASGIVSDVMDELGITGVIGVGGVRVASGDTVLADDTGLCFIPRGRVGEVLALAQQKSASEEAKCE